MKINNFYVEDRIEELLHDVSIQTKVSKREKDKLYKIKMYFPQWLRNIIFHPFNPFYSVFVQYKVHKKNRTNLINIQALQPFAINFIQYCLRNRIDFSPEQYYPQEDIPVVCSYIDNRLKSIIKGYDKMQISDSQQKISKKRKDLREKVKKENAGYTLYLDGNKYWLPQNVFEEHTYIHDYGLKYLPEEVKEYISGKDFMDIGSYLGDTALLLLKKYNPSHVFAYEPVEKNISDIRKMITSNNISNITIVEKGISDKVGTIDIFIDPEHLSGSSTNTVAIPDTGNINRQTIQVTTIDHECHNRKIGLIKMDIEGAEYAAISGGLETIRRDKPVLLISLYHTGKDFFEIPPLLKKTVPNYKFRFIDLELLSPFNEKILVAYPDKVR